jgi:hypothetical protein
MKITIAKSDVIRRKEREFVASLLHRIDQRALMQLLKHRHRIDRVHAVEGKTGDIVVVGNQIAYRFDFAVQSTISVTVDRNGAYVESAPAMAQGHHPRHDTHRPTPPASPRTPEPAGFAAAPPTEPDAVSLEQMLSNHTELAVTKTASGASAGPSTAQPSARMTRLATDAADLISKINNGQ